MLRKLSAILTTTAFTLLLAMPVTALIVQSPANAQTETTTEETADSESDLGRTIVVGDNAFTILLTRETQNAENLEVTYNLVIHPNITSDRVGLEWSVTGASEAVGETSKNLVVKKDQQFTERFTVRPRISGRTSVRVEIKGVAASSDYIAAARDEFITSPELFVQPITAEFEAAQRAAGFKSLVITVGIVLVVLIISIFALGKFLAWWRRGSEELKQAAPPQPSQPAASPS